VELQKKEISHKSTQICAYANDIVVIARNTTALKEVILTLDSEGEKMGLTINEDKTEYMEMSSTQARRYCKNLIIGDFNFEGVDSFIYLGSVVNNENKMWADIHSKIMTANRAYSVYIKLLQSKLLF
jgi:sorting nexin-29